MENSDKDKTQRGDGRGGSQQGWPRWSIWLIVGVLVLSIGLPQLSGGDDREDLDFDEFTALVLSDSISTIEINNSTGEIKGEMVKDFLTGDAVKFKTTGPLETTDELRAFYLDHGVKASYKTPKPSTLLGLLSIALPILFILAFFVWIQRRAQGQIGGIMSVGRSKAKAYDTERPGTTFSDIAGYEGVKQEINEVVDFLKQPERFAEIGARIPKGVLLVGPPGTGKTLIARAVAGEAGVPFLSVTGSDFMEMFVGVGASRVRDLFETARKLGSAIIFIDEIDSIGRKRGAGLGGGHDEREQTLNQMLAEMDGFEATEGIVMIAATNRPDVLDPALLRPGRFDRQVVVPLPEVSERLAILKVHARDKKMDQNIDLETMSKGTPGMSGADLANLVNEAALTAVRRGSSEIEDVDFEDARDRILMGQRRESVAMTEKEKEATAYHEGGHALLATVLEEADPVHKVTILPTGQALGVTQQLPQERHSYRRDYIEDTLCVMMGGRMAEEIIYGIPSTGASNDLMRGTELAAKMVREWGMSAELGPIAWGGSGEVFLGDSIMSGREYSEETSRLIDSETRRILAEQEERARQLLLSHRKGLDLIADSLLEHETITGSEVARLTDLGIEETAASNAGNDPRQSGVVDEPV